MSFGYARASLVTASGRDSYTPSLTAEQAAATYAIACILATCGARGFERVDYVLHFDSLPLPQTPTLLHEKTAGSGGRSEVPRGLSPPSALL